MIYIYTFYTDEEKIKYLKESALSNNIQINYLYKEIWSGYIDKIIAIDDILKNHLDNDIICFIDAYDVLVNQSLDYLLEKFSYYDCELLIGAELNCFPENYKDMYPNFNNIDPNINNKYKYVNSGGYIGYKYSLDVLFKWKTYDEIYNICTKGGDQSYFTEYYISHHSDKIKLDNECLIFQNLHWVDWNDLSFENGKLKNNILNVKPCFIHFNGGTWQQNNRENIMPIFLEKMKLTINRELIENLNEYKQIITSTCYPHSQI
jgi:hypothetical protein